MKIPRIAPVRFSLQLSYADDTDDPPGHPVFYFVFLGFIVGKVHLQLKVGLYLYQDIAEYGGGGTVNGKNGLSS